MACAATRSAASCGAMCSVHSQRANSNCRSAMYQVSAVGRLVGEGVAAAEPVRAAPEGPNVRAPSYSPGPFPQIGGVDQYRRRRYSAWVPSRFSSPMVLLFPVPASSGSGASM